MSNPFLKAKRLAPPASHLRKGKYAHIWQMGVEALRIAYDSSTDAHEKGVITRALNEKLGLKVIRSTPAQHLARDVNYLLFTIAGAVGNIRAASRSVAGHNHPEYTHYASAATKYANGLADLAKGLKHLREVNKVLGKRQRNQRDRKAKWKDSSNGIS